MGKPSTATHKTVWMFRSDDTDLVRFKGMLAQRYGTTVTTPVAIGEAIRIALAELNRTVGFPRQEPAEGPTFGPFTTSAFMHSQTEAHHEL